MAAGDSDYMLPFAAQQEEEEQEADAESISRARALEMFVAGEADVLMLSSLNSASGINLQVSSSLFFLSQLLSAFQFKIF